RLHRHGVDVLDARGDARDLDQVAADVPGHVGQIGDGGDHLDLRVSRRQRGGAEQGEDDERNRETLHVDSPWTQRSLKLWTWLPRMTVDCMKNWFSWGPGCSRRVYWSRRRLYSDSHSVRLGEYAVVSASMCSW